MAGRGGARPGSGRPHGSTEKAPWLNGGGLTPLETLLEIMRSVEAPLKLRAWAAKEAAPYVHRKLAPEPAGAVDDVPTQTPEEAAWSADLGMRPN